MINRLVYILLATLALASDISFGSTWETPDNKPTHCYHWQEKLHTPPLVGREFKLPETTISFFGSHEELRLEFLRKVQVNSNRVVDTSNLLFNGFFILRVNGKCEIYTLAPTWVGSERMCHIGHEVMHCLFGEKIHLGKVRIKDKE